MTTSSDPFPPGFAATVLELVDPGRCAVKTVTRQPDGSIVSSDYDNGFKWRFWPFDANADFDRMARELRRLAQQDRMILCMGSPKFGLDLTIPHRRLWTRNDCRANTIAWTTRAWIAIDVDDANVPRGLGDPGRYVEGATYVRDLVLPEEFRDATMVVSPSARTGLRGPSLLRARMWFLLDQAHELPTLKYWTRGLKASAGVGDSAIVQPGQPIYVGRARFVGMADPIAPKLWAAVARGSKDRVAIVTDRYDPIVVEIERMIGAALLAAGDDWRFFLNQTVGGDLSFFEPLTRGLGIAARSGDADTAIVRFTLALVKRRADKDRLRQYDAAWIAYSLRRFRAMDDLIRGRREAALSELYGDAAHEPA